MSTLEILFQPHSPDCERGVPGQMELFLVACFSTAHESQGRVTFSLQLHLLNTSRTIEKGLQEAEEPSYVSFGFL